MRSYRTECKKCGGHNYVVTPSKGISKCFNCGYYELDSAVAPQSKVMSSHLDEIRALYAQAAKYYHSALTPEAYTFLHNRGFTDAMIKELQLGYCPSGRSPLYTKLIAKEAGLAKYDSTAFLENRITFPYFHNGMHTEIRGRAIDPYEEVRYKSPLGSSYHRGAIYPYNYQYTAPRIIITEGEIKAAIALQYGHTAIAMPGLSIWSEGFRESPETEYIVCFDSQQHAQYNVQRAIIAIADKIPTMKVATLPLLGKKKQDIDSFILDHGVVFFTNIIHSALPFAEWYKLQRY
jgi:DNA primase